VFKAVSEAQAAQEKRMWKKLRELGVVG